MYAIVEIAGKQYKLSEGTVVEVDLLEAGPKEVVFDKVLLLVKDNEIRVGTPSVDGVKITAEVMGETKGEKLVVFKMKRKKTFRRRRGHRQHYTKLKIKKIEG